MGGLKTVVSYINQTLLPMDEKLCFSLGEHNGLASVWESVSELIFFFFCNFGIFL